MGQMWLVGTYYTQLKHHVPYVAQVLQDLPTVASTDYMKMYAEQIRAYVPSKHYHVLGTDGFGRSDSRANLREHFEVDERYVVAALAQLAKEGTVENKWLRKLLLNSA